MRKITNRCGVEGSEERLTLPLEYAPDAIYLLDSKGRFADGNKAAEELVGYKREELIGKHMLKSGVLPKDQIPKAIARHAMLMAGKKLGPSEFTLKRKDGSIIEVEIRSYALKIKDKSFVMGIVRDVTEQKIVEEALRESEERYRSLFDNMQDGFALHKIITDEKGKPIDYVFLEVNAAFEEMTGLKKEDIVGKRVSEAIPGVEGESADWIGRFGKVALEGENARFIQYSETLKKWYYVTAYSPKKDYFASIIEDYTERKEAEIALEEAYQELKSLDVIKDDFINATSHALKTPLTSITSFVNLLFREKLGPINVKQKQGLDIVRLECDRLHRLINHILDSSKIDAGEFVLHKQKMNLTELVANSITRVTNTRADNEDQVLLHSAGMVHVDADPFWLEKVVDNLIGNAVKFTQNGRIDVTIEKGNGKVKFSIKDSGRGISKEHIPLIFDKFYQAEKQTATGTGLGLYISQKLIEAHGGEIDCRSAGRGKGSTFWFTLPT